MSVIQDGIDSLVNAFRPGLDIIKRKVFGSNNERLDFVMDSFYKLSPQQQTGALFAAGLILAVLVLGIFGVYFSRIQALESELNDGFEALRELRTLSTNYRHEKARMDWLVKRVESKTSNIRPKSFFSKKADQVGVKLESLRSEEADIDKSSLLGEKFKEIRVNFRMPQVSVPRMLKFLGEIEKSDKTLTIKDLRIRARYGDRLYFDTEAQAVGFKRL